MASHPCPPIPPPTRPPPPPPTHTHPPPLHDLQFHPPSPKARGAVDVYCVDANLGTFAQLVVTRNIFFGAGVPAAVQW